MRTIDPGLITALGAATGIRRQLVAFEFGGGTVRLTTAGQNVVATTAEDGTATWYAMGGLLTVGAIEEKPDLGGSGMQLEVSGVDQSIADLLLSDQFRGRLCRAYEIRLDPAAGTILGSPLRTCRGRMNGEWRIEQTKSGQRAGPSTVTIRTKITDLGADLDHTSGIQMNLGSHQLYYPANTVQTIALSGATDADTYQLNFGAQATAAIRKDATAAAVQAALAALSNVGAGRVIVAGAARGPYTVTFAGGLPGVGLLLAASGATGGLAVAIAGLPADTFMANVAGLANQTVYWDGTAPTRLKQTSNG